MSSISPSGVLHRRKVDSQDLKTIHKIKVERQSDFSREFEKVQDVIREQWEDKKYGRIYLNPKTFPHWCSPQNKVSFIHDEKPIEHLFQQHISDFYKTFIDGNEAFKIFSMDPEMMRIWSLTRQHFAKADLPIPQIGDSEKGFKEFFKDLVLKDSAPPPRTVDFVSKGSHLDDEKRKQISNQAPADKPKQE